MGGELAVGGVLSESTRDVHEIAHEIYAVKVSPSLISEIIADLDADVTTWRTRLLSATWPIMYFDGVVVHVSGAHPGKTHIQIAFGICSSYNSPPW